MKSIIGLTMVMVASIASSATAQPQAASAILGPNARYVAMGSSYAAGPGVPDAADEDVRCARSTNNYAHQLARRHGLSLVDVSCSGATTKDILAKSDNRPAQIDAVTADTKLVSVTTGGNDVGFVTLLGAASCRQLEASDKLPGGKCPVPPVVTNDTWRNLSTAMKRIADEVHARAPAARLVFVDYLTVLPTAGQCAATPMSANEANAARAIAKRLAALTAAVAKASGATVIRASELSKTHDACSNTAWINGFPLPGQARFVPYHPNLKGMTAVADAIGRTIR